MDKQSVFYRCLRAGILFVFSLFLLSGAGCALMGVSRKANVEEAPPYYGSKPGTYVTVPMEHSASTSDTSEGARCRNNVSSREELERLQRDAVDWSEEQERQKALKEEKEGGKKKGFWNWFSSGDRMTGMSQEAKAVNSRLEERNMGL